MNDNEFVNNLIEYRFMDKIWNNVIKYIIKPLDDNEAVIKLLALYFVYISDGSSAMPLDKNILTKEWNNKCASMEILFRALESEELENELLMVNSIKEEGINTIANIDELYSSIKLVGENKLFIIENSFIFARKYYNAKNGIKDSIKRLFLDFNDECDIPFNVDEVWNSAALKQKEVIEKGLFKNLIITGGPGTGKTTAVFYLLLALLKNYKDYKVYMTAPSGKAASRIKESINGEIANAKRNNLLGYDDEIKKLTETSESTIHRLLGNDRTTNDFEHNLDNQFEEKAIFIIDESSMIDVCIFDSLLKAIPNKARVFILGDKYQLPSVECGAVLADLLNNPELKDNIVELNESHRFKKGSPIYELADKVNNGISVNIKLDEEFNIIDRVKGEYPVFYYNDENNPNGDFNKILELWAKRFYSKTQEECTGIKFNENVLDRIFSKIDEARVLSSQNEGRIGVNNINKIIKDTVIDRSFQTNIRGFYPGMPLMILKNNTSLDLYNGDTGILVNFENNNNLYFLIEKDSKYYKKDSLALDDKILKVGKYMLYPLRMLDLNNIIYAYSITIHKSQGSGYENIMVVLPKKKGHPLLNRQILYTAITRTKGPTYLISNEERINEAIASVVARYTRIFN